MNRMARTAACTLAALLIAFAGPGAADDFDLDWWTFDSGGQMWTTGGDFELSGTIGQPAEMAVHYRQPRPSMERERDRAWQRVAP